MQAHKHEHALPCQTCVRARLEAFCFRPGLLNACLALCATLGPVPQVSTCSQLEPLNGTQSLTRWRVIAMNATLAVRPNAALIETARNETARRVAGATALDVGATLAFNGTNDTSVLPTIFTAIVQAVVCSPCAPAVQASPVRACSRLVQRFIKRLCTRWSDLQLWYCSYRHLGLLE